jgi:DUF971 family protein
MNYGHGVVFGPLSSSRQLADLAASGLLIALLPARTTLRAMRLEPKNVQLIGEELAVHWNDGEESYFPLERLRRACPCATCGGEPDVLGNIARPNVTYTDRSFELIGWQLIGGYALQPRWADGHNTGLYSFQYLRRLAAASSSYRARPRRRPRKIGS